MNLVKSYLLEVWEKSEETCKLPIYDSAWDIENLQ